MIDEPWVEGLLRRLAMSDERAIGSLFAGEFANGDNALLDERSRAMVRLAALIATDSARPSYQLAVNAARAAGVSEDDVAGVLTCVAPIVGAARVASAAPFLASALGYEIDALD